MSVAASVTASRSRSSARAPMAMPRRLGDPEMQLAVDEPERAGLRDAVGGEDVAMHSDTFAELRARPGWTAAEAVLKENGVR